MAEKVTVNTVERRRLNIVVPIFLLLLMLVARFVPQLWDDGPSWTWAIASFGPTLAGLMLLLGWWIGVSRATARERVFGFVGCVASITIACLFLDPSIQGLIPVLTLPIGLAAFGIGMIAVSRSQSPGRVWCGVLVCALACGATTLLRNEGAWGSFAFDLDYRFSQTDEAAFLEELSKRRTLDAAGPEGLSVELPEVGEWPGFRGADRSGTQKGMRFEDWNDSPPEELWRIKVGPSWSSVSVSGNYIFTQEQRGEDEATVCYRLTDGTEIWENSVEARFFEALGGLGPRATPTVVGSAVYSTGASGVVTKVDASTGKLLWQKDLKEAANRNPPMWGFSSSPWISSGDEVVIHAAGKGDLGVLAFAAADGSLRWSAPAGEMSYGSIQSINLLDNTYLALMSELGLELFSEDGQPVFTYSWPHTGYRALQPLAFASDGVNNDCVLLPTGMGAGTRAVQLRIDESGEISAEEMWTSRRMKPDFNDALVHKGHVYGFDNSVFASINLDDGSLNWKGGRYGKGQALLLSDSDRIVVLSETGELALLKASPESHQEIAKFQAIEGRTWNHPVVVGDRLIVRNAAEMVCYRMKAIAEATNLGDSQ